MKPIKKPNPKVFHRETKTKSAVTALDLIVGGKKKQQINKSENKTPKNFFILFCLFLISYALRCSILLNDAKYYILTQTSVLFLRNYNHFRYYNS